MRCAMLRKKYCSAVTAKGETIKKMKSADIR
jgi:hypothetical protein